MKHWVFAIASVLAVAAWAEDEQPTVTPVGGASAVQVDVVKYANPPQHAIVAVRAGSLANGGAVSVHDYVKTSTLSVDTVLYVLQGTGYQAYVLKENNEGAKVWKPALVALPGSQGEASAAVESLTLSVGTAFWIVQPDSKPNPIIIYGAPVTPGVTTLTAGRTLVPNLAASAVDVAALITNASKGDQIVMPDGTRYSYNNKENKWGSVVGPGEVIPLGAIPAGGGFWYMAQKAGVKIDWTATAK